MKDHTMRLLVFLLSVAAGNLLPGQATRVRLMADID